MKLKSAKQLGITERQRKNIAKLAVFVRDKVAPPKFNIENFHSEDDFPSEAKYECGTTACFCGYGPLAGIKALNGEDWNNYADRCFGSTYNILFNAVHKNSKTAAVKRAAWLLMNGFPECDYFSEWEWEAPKNFKPDWKAIEELAAK